MLKLKLQYFGYLIWRTDSFEKTPMLGKIEGGRRRGQQRMRWLDDITNSMHMSLSNSGSWWWTGRPGVLQSMGSQWVRHDWVTELYWKESLFLCSEFFKGVSSQNKIQRYWPSLQRHFQAFFSRSISLIFCYSLNLLIKFQPQDFRLAIPACNILSLDISMVFESFLN